jgi:3-isopropylmalate dehydrogenase
MIHCKLFILPGDGIGPEVMAEAEKIAGFLTEGASPALTWQKRMRVVYYRPV